MRPNLTIVSIALFAAVSARAEWVKIGDTGEATLYFDPATTSKIGNMARVWSLMDYRTRLPDGSMSIRQKQEFDCKKGSYQALAISKHTQPMANGDTLFDFTSTGKWLDTPPGSGWAKLQQVVCAKNS